MACGIKLDYKTAVGFKSEHLQISSVFPKKTDLKKINLPARTGNIFSNETWLQNLSLWIHSNNFEFK